MKTGKMIVGVMLAVVVLAVGAGGMWYFSVPHNAKEQLAYAQKLERALEAKSATAKGMKELMPEIEKVVAAYDKVGKDYGKVPEAAEAIKQAAKVWEKYAADDEKAIKKLDELIKDFPAEKDAGFALFEQARLLKKQAE